MKVLPSFCHTFSCQNLLSLLHLRKVLGEPQSSIARIYHNGDTADITAGGQDVLAVAVVGRFLVHHGLMETQFPLDITYICVLYIY